MDLTLIASQDPTLDGIPIQAGDNQPCTIAESSSVGAKVAEQHHGPTFDDGGSPGNWRDCRNSLITSAERLFIRVIRQVTRQYVVVRRQLIVSDCQDAVSEEVRVSIRVVEFGPGENPFAQVGSSGHGDAVDDVSYWGNLTGPFISQDRGRELRIDTAGLQPHVLTQGQYLQLALGR